MTPCGKCDVIHVASIEALVQYIGYLKYVSNGPVLFRGQDKLHDPYVPLPSILRTLDIQSAAQEMQNLVEMAGVWNGEESACVDEPFLCATPAKLRGPFDFGVKKYAIEPLLQHYGIRTRWLDLTDSLPFALQFALMNYEEIEPTVILSGSTRYQLERDAGSCSKVLRNVKVMERVMSETDEGYAYLYVMELAGYQSGVEGCADGLSKFKNGWLIDARREMPSFFLRPHVQHGLLFFSRHFSKDKQIELYSEPIRTALFEIPIREVKRWLGDGKLFGISTVYPSGRIADRQSNGKVRILDSGLYQFEQRLLKLHKMRASMREVKSGEWNPGYTCDEVIERFSGIVNYVSSAV